MPLATKRKIFVTEARFCYRSNSRGAATGRVMPGNASRARQFSASAHAAGDLGATGALCGSTAMPQGNVKWFDSKKGFGFIISPEGKDVFVHFTSIEGDGFRSLKDGETVDYEQIQGEKGLLAQHVKRIAAKAAAPMA